LEGADQANVARLEGLTRARVTQVMGMLRLAPEIQQHIQSIPETPRRPLVAERTLRPIESISNCRDQLQEFQELLV
jgi:hypothetical protein